MAYCVSPSQTKDLNAIVFLFLLWNMMKKNHKKWFSDYIKDRLLDLLVNIQKTVEKGLNDVVRNYKNSKEAVTIIKEFEDLLKRQN